MDDGMGLKATRRDSKRVGGRGREAGAALID